MTGVRLDCCAVVVSSGAQCSRRAKEMEVMLKPLWLLLLLLLGSSVPIMARSSGAPEEVCSTLTPGGPHVGYGQNSPSPYSITLSQATYTAGGAPITVNLTGLCGNIFKGFLIQARRADTAQNQSEIIGSFATISGTRAACTNALTHSSSDTKTSLSLSWTPPSSSAGHVHFRVTFMQQLQAWWGNVKSAVLRDSAIPGTPGTLETASTTIDPTCPTTTAAQTTSTSQTTVESPNTTLSLGSTAMMNSSETAESSTTAGSVAGQTTSAPMTITNTAASSNTIASTTDAASTASSQVYFPVSFSEKPPAWTRWHMWSGAAFASSQDEHLSECFA